MPLAPAWVNDYIGVPFLDGGRNLKGADCWGLLTIVLEEQFSVVVPHYGNYTYGTEDEIEIAARRIAEESTKPPWVQVGLDVAKSGDVLLLRILGHPIHVSTVVAPCLMLHTSRGINSVIEEYDGYMWRNRILGVFRHAALNH